MDPIRAQDPYESPEARLARTMCVLCEGSALECQCPPLVLEQGEPSAEDTPNGDLMNVLRQALVEGLRFEQVGMHDPGPARPWYYGNLMALIPEGWQGRNWTVAIAYLQPWRIPLLHSWSVE